MTHKKGCSFLGQIKFLFVCLKFISQQGILLILLKCQKQFLKNVLNEILAEYFKMSINRWVFQLFLNEWDFEEVSA